MGRAADLLRGLPMTSAKFWFYPGGEGHIEEIEVDLDIVGISDLQINAAIAAGVATSIHGAPSCAVLSGYDDIRIVIASFEDDALRRKLERLDRHLRAGFACGFALDADTAWAGFTTTPVPQDATVLPTSGNAFAYNASAALSSGDEVLIRSAPPEAYKAEELVVSSVTTAGTAVLISTSDDTMFRHMNPPSLVSHRFFYPVLRFVGDPTQTLLTSDRHWTYSFNAPLRLDWTALMNFYAAIGQGDSPDALDTLTLDDEPSSTLDDMLRAPGERDVRSWLHP